MTALYLYCLAFGVSLCWRHFAGNLRGMAWRRIPLQFVFDTLNFGTAFNLIWWSLHHLGAM